MNVKDRRLIIVSGLSGAGKTVVLNTLEDLSYYTIDNLPLSLFNELIRQFSERAMGLAPLIAIGIDARNSRADLVSLPKRAKSLLNKHVLTELIFIDADDDTLTKRFSETRRKHPLSSDSLSLLDAIHKERELTLKIAQAADLRIDTSYLDLNGLRDIVCERIACREKTTLSLQIISFGYKNGIPRDADFVFDLRCLPNPYWKKHLRQFSGKDQPIIDFLSTQERVLQMLNDLGGFFERWIPQFESDDRSYLSIAFGCTGGQHRSVFVAEHLAEKLKKQDKQIIIRHRDL